MINAWCTNAAGWGEAELSVAGVFRRLDRDGSGTLDLSEVERLAAALGVVLSRNSAQDMFAQVGTIYTTRYILYYILYTTRYILYY